MDLTSIMASVRRRWWALAAAALVSGLTGTAIAAQQPLPYEARAQVLIGPVTTDASGVRLAERTLGTFGELVTSSGVLTATASTLHGEGEPVTVRSEVDPPTRHLTVIASHTEPRRAVDAANQVAELLTDIELPGGAAAASAPRVVGPAHSASVAGEHPATLGAFTGVAGLLVALGLLLGDERRRSPACSLGLLEGRRDLSLLGVVPAIGRGGEERRTALAQRVAASQHEHGDPSPHPVLLMVSCPNARTGGALCASIREAQLRDRHPAAVVTVPASEAGSAGHADAAILLARAGRDRMRSLEEAAALLRAKTTPLLGTVLERPSRGPGRLGKGWTTWRIGRDRG